MSKFIVDGGHKLKGRVKVQGSKNAAFPVMAASILTRKTCVIKNVPDILDVRNFLEILKFLGARVEFRSHRVIINSRDLKPRVLPRKLMGKLRGSIVVAGALLSRLGLVKMAYPGGDAIGSRPIDAHLAGFRRLGVKVSEGQNYLNLRAKKLKGSKIVLPVTSVTATENLILASVLAKGTSEIRVAATEPHVQDLCKFLNKMGARISGVGTPNLRIRGVGKLHAATFSLCADEIEAVTFCVAAAATKGEVEITGIELENLDAPLAVLSRMNVSLETSAHSIRIRKPKAALQSTRIVTGVFPQLLTDDQPLFGVLATQAQGETAIHDWIHEGRQGYLRALQKMGAQVKFDDLHRSRILGPTRLLGAEIKAPDIRAGASILIAALVAKGESILYNAEIIDRGYERLDERLRSLGAKIERLE